MEIEDILAPGRVAIDVPANSKKAVLEILSGLLSAEIPRLGDHAIFDSLLARERLGSTCLGHGVAIPHSRLPQHDRALGAFARITGRIDFDAADNLPVDLFFALTVPNQATEDHLQILAKLAEMFSDPALLEAIRASDSTREIYKLLTGA